jgi:polyphosphate kinase 2 (PPK2 family)
MIGVWNRSHYEDVLVTRVHKMIDQGTWEQRYKDITAFEKLLSHSGTTIRKFFLYIDKDEQKERLQARLGDPAKHWKFTPATLRNAASGATIWRRIKTLWQPLQPSSHRGTSFPLTRSGRATSPSLKYLSKRCTR